MKLNPGSQEAARAGCDCSPLHNNNGKKQPEGGWRVRATCKMHGLPAEKIPPEVKADDMIIVVPKRWSRLRDLWGGWRRTKENS